MAKHGYIIEANISAKDSDALNRTVVAETDLDGGAMVKITKMENGEFKATKAVSTDGLGLWMVYNPSEHFTEVNGKIFAGLSADPRDYTNIAKRPVDVFMPKAGTDMVVLTKANIADGATVTAGSFLELDATGKYAVKGTATEGKFALKVLEVKTIPFPQAGIGFEQETGIVCEVAQN